MKTLNSQEITQVHGAGYWDYSKDQLRSNAYFALGNGSSHGGFITNTPSYNFGPSNRASTYLTFGSDYHSAVGWGNNSASITFGWRF